MSTRKDQRDIALQLPSEVSVRRDVEFQAAEVVTRGDRARWEACRSSPWIGSSELAAVLGEDPDRGPLEVYCRKLGLELPADQDEPGREGAEVSEAMRWGTRLEPGVAFGYALETGDTIVDPGRWTLYRRRDDPAFACTPDYFVEREDGLGVLESKTAGAYRAKDWREEPPLKFQIQVQHQLWTLDLRRGTLAVLLGGNRLWYRHVERDDRFCEAAVAAVHAFLRRLRDRDPPPATGGARESAAVTALYRRHDAGKVITLPAELRPTYDAWLQARARAAAAKEEQEALANQLRMACGDAERALFADGHGVSWKTQERTATRPAPDLPKLVSRVLREVAPRV